MATVVDALIMTLGLDTRDYDKGQKRTTADLDKLKKQSGAVAKEMSEQGKRAAEFFGSIKTELLGLLAVFGAATGLKEFIASNVQGQAALGRTAKNLDMSGKRVAAWTLIAKEMGGQVGDATIALQAFAGGLAEASIKGHSALTDTARANGINLQGIKDSEEGLLRISKRITELPRQQAMYLANELGVGSMFNELMLGPEELQRRVAFAEKHSKITPESIKAAQDLQQQWADIQQRFSEISQGAFIKIWPSLEKIAERFAKWMDSVDWEKVADGIANIIAKAKDVVEVFGGWKNVALVLGGILTLKVLAPVLGLAGGLLRLVPLLATGAAGLVGMTGAAIALSAALGALLGLGIHKMTEGTGVGDWISRKAGEIMAGLGNSTAQKAIIADNWSKLSATQRQSMVGAYMQLNDAQKANYDKTSPELSRLVHEYAGPRSVVNKPSAPLPTDADLTGANPTKSQIYGSNAELFAALEKRGNLPAGLLQKMFMRESGGGKNLISPAGAKGPFQFMDATAREQDLRGNEVMDLDHAAAATTRYLVKLRAMFGGDIIKAVAAYNAGPGNVRKYGGVPPFAETQAYVKSMRLGAAQAVASRAPNNVRSSQSTSETHITGPITIQTKATDAKGIAIDMRKALADHMLVAQADTGIN